jgi:hypothetical protein
MQSPGHALPHTKSSPLVRSRLGWINILPVCVIFGRKLPLPGGRRLRGALCYCPAFTHYNGWALSAMTERGGVVWPVDAVDGKTAGEGEVEKRSRVGVAWRRVVGSVTALTGTGTGVIVIVCNTDHKFVARKFDHSHTHTHLSHPSLSISFISHFTRNVCTWTAGLTIFILPFTETTYSFLASV